MKDLVYWICDECAKKANAKCRFPFITIHRSICEACCEEKGVAAARDYGYPKVRLGEFRDDK